jgi:hypothetical protein
MIKTQRIKMFIGLSLLALTMVGAACSSSRTTAQVPRVKSAESPTPEYKPLKRVSKDIIKSDVKEEAVKVKSN